jgi:hypothetical protein
MHLFYFLTWGAKRGRRVRLTTSPPSVREFAHLNLRRGAVGNGRHDLGMDDDPSEIRVCHLLDATLVTETQTSDLRFQWVSLRMYEVPHAWYGGPVQVVLQVFTRRQGALPLLHYSSVKHFQFRVLQLLKANSLFLAISPFNVSFVFKMCGSPELTLQHSTTTEETFYQF